MLFSNRPVRPRSIAGILVLLLFSSWMVPPPTALAAKGDCGQPSTTGSTPKSSDALAALKAAVGTIDCDLCVCDVTNDSKITASDALRILKKAVGQDVTLTCPACVPTLKGTVFAPAAMLAAPNVGTAAIPSGGPPMASVEAVLPIAGLMGLAPAPGATVELLDLDSEGNPQLPAVASTTTKSDGTFRFQPAPVASSSVMVRASLGGQVMRAFVSNATSLQVDPASEFVVDAALEAVTSDSGADLGDLSVDEVAALVRELRQTEIDVGAASSIPSALDILEDRTGGVLRSDIAAFATSTGSSPTIAGNFHLVNLGIAFTRMYTPATDSLPSVNERWVHTYNSADPLVVDGAGLVTQPLASGRSHTLKEVSGSMPQVSGPDLAVNATVTLESQDVNETPGSAAGRILAADHGEILFDNPLLVGAGALASGSNFALLTQAARVTTGNGIGGLGFLVRQGSGMSKSSLTGTYWMVHLELEMETNTGGNTVTRSVGARIVTHTATFDGNGGFSLGAEDNIAGRLHKSGPTPDQAPADPTVELQVEESTDPATTDLAYTVGPDGTLTAKSGDSVIGVGALSGDGRILLLRVGEDDAGFSDSGILVGLKRGSGMNNASASGVFRSVEAALRIEASLTPGQVDVQPSTNARAVSFEGGIGGVTMDGAGHVSVARSMGRSVRLGEVSGVLQTTGEPDLVLDAAVETTAYADAEGDGSETHTYTVASNGKVTVDGSLTGYLSSDGKVFLLPITESETGSGTAGLLIALKQP